MDADLFVFYAHWPGIVINEHAELFATSVINGPFIKGLFSERNRTGAYRSVLYWVTQTSFLKWTIYALGKSFSKRMYLKIFDAFQLVLEKTVFINIKNS